VSNYIAVEIAIEQIEGSIIVPNLAMQALELPGTPTLPCVLGRECRRSRLQDRFLCVGVDVVGEFSFRLAQPSFLGTDGGLRRVPPRNFLVLRVRFALFGQCRTQRFADLIEKLSSGFQDCSSCR